MPADPSFDTLCAHAGDDTAGANPPLSPPLILSSVFETPTLDLTDRAVTGEPGTYIYARDANPTVVALEAAVASLEGADGAVAMASGMGAISALFLAMLRAGDHIVVGREMYGATLVLLSDFMSRLGISATLADATDTAAVEAAIQPNTKLIFVETVSNPLMRLADIPALAEVAKRHAVTLAVDATFTSPVLSRPLTQGADLVMHSATKYLSGHSDVMAGVVAGSTRLIRKLRANRKFFGPICSPMDAWLTLRGMKTLALRVERHTSNALALAQSLEAHSRVKRVCYAGLKSNPQHALAATILPHGVGGMLSFEIEGGVDAVSRFISGLTLVRFAGSLGDVTTTISHPALTSHRGLTPEERAALGITDGLIRVSTGIEAPADICTDFDRGLAAV